MYHPPPLQPDCHHQRYQKIKIKHKQWKKNNQPNTYAHTISNMVIMNTYLHQIKHDFIPRQIHIKNLDLEMRPEILECKAYPFLVRCQGGPSTDPAVAQATTFKPFLPAIYVSSPGSK